MNEDMTPLPGSEILPLPGSEKKPVTGAHSTGPTHPEETVAVTLRLRAKVAGTPDKPITTSSDEDVKEVTDWAGKAGLTVVSSSKDERNVKLTGTVGQMNAAFGVALANYQAPPDAENKAGFNYRGRTGAIYLPKNLVIDNDGTPIIEGVFGLDDRPAAKPHFHRPNIVAHAGGGGFLATQLAKIYNFAPGGGAGQIGKVISLGGTIYPQDVIDYCQLAGISPVPEVRVVLVDGYRPSPSDADVENALDVQTIIGGAPNVKRVVVYQSPNTDAGFLDNLTAAVHDTVNVGGTIDISWGGGEQNWTQSAMRAFAQVISDAKALSIVVVPASGDNGSRDGNSQITADFPSSAPDALAAGGTKLIASGSSIVSEDAWSDGGGAPSRFFPRPPYQDGVTVPLTGRGVCDVAAVADPSTGYIIVCNGQQMVIGGTSGAAPLWVANILCVNANLALPIKDIHALVYQKGVCRDVVNGSNGDYSAGPGWDIPTGNGSPNGMNLLAAAQAVASGPVINMPPPITLPPVQTGVTEAQLKAIIDGSILYLEKQATSRFVVRIMEQARRMLDSEIPALWAFLHSIGVV